MRHGPDRSRPTRRPGAARVFVAGILVGALVLAAFSASLPAAAQVNQEVSVPDSWPLKPEDISVGESFRLIFVTDDHRKAHSSDIDVYNKWVQNAAGNGHRAIRKYKDGFRAVASTDSVDARTNAGLHGPGLDRNVPIYWLSGNKVADDYDDFLDGTWDDEVNWKTEHGEVETINGFWTGSNDQGTKHYPLGGGFGSASVGFLNSSENNPLGGSLRYLRNDWRLYALSPVFVAGPRPVDYEILTNTSLGLVEDKYEEGERIEIEVEFDVPVTVHGDPRFNIYSGANSDPKAGRQVWRAAYQRGSGSKYLVFGYVVQSNDRDPDGFEFDFAHFIDTSDGSIRSATGDDTATFYLTPDATTLRAPGVHLTGIVDGSLSATFAPRIDSVEIVSTPGTSTSNGPETVSFYGRGDRIRFSVVFDRPVRVAGAPELVFSLGSGGAGLDRREAQYTNRAGPSALEFGYTVEAEDQDSDGLSISGRIELSRGSSIRAANGDDATLTFVRHSSHAGHKVDGGQDASPSAIARLDRLALSAGGTAVPLDAPLTAARTFYDAEVGHPVSRITVAAATSRGARLAFLNADHAPILDADADAADFQVYLLPGRNIFKVRVTAANGVSRETYTVTVARRETSSALGRLAPSHGTLEPALASNVQRYTVSVPQSVARLTLNAAAADPAATLEILDGTDAPIPDADETSAHHQIDLDEGENVIRLRVTASGGRPIRDYTVTATRERRPATAIRLLAAEGVKGRPLEVPLVLSESNSRPVVVTWSTADGTAVAGDDYTAVTDATVTIAPGERVASLQIETHLSGSSGVDETIIVRARRAPFPGEVPPPEAIETVATILVFSESGSRFPPRELRAVARERRRSFDFANWESATEIDLSWMAPEQVGGVDIAGYRVEVSSDSGATWQLLAPQVVGTSYTHREGLSARAVRKYRVRAVTTNGTEGPVAVVEGTTGHGVRRIAVASQPANGDAYRTGESIVVEVTMSTPMTYDAPQLPLLVGGQARNAVCWDGTGSQNGVLECPNGAIETLRLSYKVQAGDLDEDGIAVAPDSLTGKEFRRPGNPVATAELQGTAALFHPGAGPFAGHRVNHSPPSPPPPPLPQVSVSAAPPVREGEAAVFAVTLSRPVQEWITVGWSTAADAAAHEDDNGTAPAAEPRRAAANGDYGPVAAGAVTFAPGTTEQTVTVATRTDNRDEYDETFLVRLDSVGGAIAGLDPAASAAVATILDTNAPPAIEVFGGQIHEGGNLVFQVIFPGSEIHRSRKLAWSTADGTATAGADYTAVAAGTLTLLLGSQSGVLLVETLHDEASEEEETVRVRVGYPAEDTDATGLAAVEATGTIHDGGAPSDVPRPTILIHGLSSAQYISTAPTIPLYVGYFSDIGSNSVEGFRIDISADRGRTWRVLEPSVPATPDHRGRPSAIFIHRDLTPGANFRYRARAVGANGVESTPSIPVEIFVRSGVLRIEPLSRPASGDTYRVGEEIVFRVHLGGTMQFHDPRLPILIGGRTRYAECREPVPSPLPGRDRACPRERGSQVDLSYTVRADDLDADGVAIAATALWAGEAQSEPDRTVDSRIGISLEYERSYRGESQPLLHSALGPLSGHRVEGARVSLAAAEAVEGSPLAFPVTLSHASAEPVEVAWSTTDGSATAGEDYTAASGSVTFAPGETEKTLTVATVGDALDEAPETFTLTLDSVTGAHLHETATSATGTVIDDDDTPTVALAVAPALEGDALEVAAVLSAPSGQALEVSWETADGSATAGEDYTAATGTVTFAPGEVRKVLRVETLEDTAQEEEETVRFLARRSQVDDESDAPDAVEATAAILDDDGPVGRLGPPVNLAAAVPLRTESQFTNWSRPDRIEVSWDPPATDGGLTVAGYRLEVSSDGGLQWRDLVLRLAATNYVHEGPGAGETRQYRVRAVADDSTEGPPSSVAEARTGDGVLLIEVISRPASGDTYTVGDGQSRGERIVLAVTMSAPMIYDRPRIKVLVDRRFDEVSHTAECGGTINIAGVTPAVACPDGATARLELSFWANTGDEDRDGIAVVANSLSGVRIEQVGGGYADLNRQAALLHPGFGPFAGHKVDYLPPTVSISGPQELREGETATLTAELSRPAVEAVTVTWSTAEDSSAHAGDSNAPATEPRRALRGDYDAVVAGTLTFAPGETQKSLTMSARPDDLDEYDETFLVRLDTVQGGNARLSASSMVSTLKILDETPAPVLEAVAEEAVEGTRLAFHVTLAGSGSERAWTLTWSTVDGTALAGEDYTAVAAGTLVIPPGRNGGSVTVSTIDDADQEDEESFAVRFAYPPGEADVADRPAAEATGRLHDNDTAGALGPPGNLTASAPTDASDSGIAGNPSPSRISLSWDAPSGTTDIEGYRVDVSADGGRTWRVLAALVTGLSHLHTGIPEAGSARRYRVRAIGTGSVEGPPTQPVDATTGLGIVRIEVVSRPAEGDTYRVGEEIAFRMHLAGGWQFENPHLPLLIGDQTRDALCRGKIQNESGANNCPGSHGSVVDFSYVVQAWDLDQDGIAIAADSFWINGPNELSGAYHFSSQADPMPHAAVGPLAGHKVDGRPLVVSISGPQELREGETATLTVELSRPAAEAVSVTWFTAEDGSAHDGDSDAPATEPRRASADDYEAVASGTLTFAPGETRKSLMVTARPDALDEYDETFVVRLNSVEGGGAVFGSGGDTLKLKILDETPAPALAATAEEAVEGTGLAFHVTLAGSGRERARTLSWSTVDGTALAGEDYTAVAAGTLVIRPGRNRGSVTVSTIDDADQEGAESFAVRFAYPPGETDVADRPAAEAAGRLHDNDTPGVPGPPRNLQARPPTDASDSGRNKNPSPSRISLSWGAPSGSTDIEGYRVDVSADGGRTWRVLAAPVTGLSHAHTGIPEPGSARRYQVRAIGTGGVEGPPTQPVDATTGLGIVRIEVVSRPAEGDTYRVGEEITFRMHLAGSWIFVNPHLPLRIGDRNRDAGCPVNLPNQNAHRCLEVHGSAVDLSYVVQAGDLDPDGIDIAADSFWIDTAEEFSGAELFNGGQSDPMPHAAVGPLPGHKVDGGGVPEEETGPEEPVLVSVAVAVAEAVEGSALAFPVTLSRAAEEAVTVAWATVDGTAVAGADYTAASGILTFTAGEIAKTVSVSSVVDTRDEEAETLTLSLFSATGAQLADTARSAVGTIVDDDDPPSLNVGGARVTEGGTAVLALSLAEPSARQVTVSWSTADGTATAGADYTAETSGTVVFVPGTVSATLRVVTVDDRVTEVEETLRVRAQIQPYEGEEAPPTFEATVTILDDGDLSPVDDTGTTMPPAGPTATIWSATITVGSTTSGGSVKGYARGQFGNLAVPQFMYADSPYEATRLVFGNGVFALRLDAALPPDSSPNLFLKVGVRYYALSFSQYEISGAEHEYIQMSGPRE